MSPTATQSKPSRRFRLLVRCSAFAMAVILVLPVLPWSWTPLVVPSLSPYVLIGSAIASRSIHAATFVGLPVLGIVLVRRRWFCRYVCPVGLMTEAVGRVRRSGRSTTVGAWIASAASEGGTGKLSADAVTSAGEQTTPGRAGLMRRLPPLGQWIVLLTLGGACCGYPLLLWMDPLAIFHGVFTLWDGPVGLAGEVSAAALGAVLTISLLLPGAWCLRICPLGATQDLLALPAKGVRNLFSATRACGWETAGQKTVPDTFLSRRSVLSTCVGAVFFGLGARWGIGASRSGGSKPLRPPGSADETRFCGLCIRCGNCIRACPAGIIEPDSESDGIAGFLSPVLRFRDDYCREDCRRCTEVCPSGAIGRISLEEKPTSRIGVAVVDASICVLADDKECDKCARICPYEAIKIVWSEEEYIALPQVDRETCPGCGACEVVCPGTNDWERQNSDEPIPLRKAIEVRPLGT